MLTRNSHRPRQGAPPTVLELSGLILLGSGVGGFLAWAAGFSLESLLMTSLGGAIAPAGAVIIAAKMISPLALPRKKAGRSRGRNTSEWKTVPVTPMEKPRYVSLTPKRIEEPVQPVRPVSDPTLTMRDTNLYDAIWRAYLGRWEVGTVVGLREHEKKHFFTAKQDVKEKAYDGNLVVYGKLGSADVWQEIPKQFWKDGALEFAGKSTPSQDTLIAQPSQGRGNYRDLKTSRVRVEALWPAAVKTLRDAR